MLDSITIQRIQLEHPAVRADLLTIFNEIDAVLRDPIGARGVQMWRSFPEQHQIFLQGRFGNKGPVVTNADAGHSYHNYGLAVDVCLLNDKNHDGHITSDEINWSQVVDLDGDKVADFTEIANIFVRHGWTWGKSWNDNPHFEKKFGYSIAQLLAKYNAKDFIPGTNYVRL